MSGADLEIKRVKNDSLSFFIAASSGANEGQVEGFAIIKGSIATFIEVDDADTTCIIKFKLMSDSVIVVEQIKGNCAAGNGVGYSGTYQKGLKRELSETLLTLNVFTTKSQNEAFRVLVKDDYALFINSTQLVYMDNDLDSLNASVHSAGVRGLFTYMENIIMIDKDNNIWAAVLDNDKVYYFTNDSRYKTTLPKTIDKWREKFKDREMVFR